MLFLTNFLIIVGVMAFLVAYVFGVLALSEWVGNKWGAKGFDAVFGMFIFLPIAVILALGLTYG